MGLTSLKCQEKKVCLWKQVVHPLLDAACAEVHPSIPRKGITASHCSNSCHRIK